MAANLRLSAVAASKPASAFSAACPAALAAAAAALTASHAAASAHIPCTRSSRSPPARSPA